MSAAFVLTAPRPATHLSFSRTVSSVSTLRASRHTTRRARFTANAETDEKPASSASETSAPPATPFETPSFDTTVFSDFVENLQTKVEDSVAKVQEIDPEEVGASVKENFTGLIDNLLAGDWLNRGELYGAIQLLFVIFILRDPGFLNGIVGFLVGPCTLFVGAAISGKSLFDLGRQQLSIWPAPVPSGELKTDGLYEYVRHPMYSGLLLACAGFSVSTGSPARFAITLAFAAFLAKKVEIEEEFLSDAYPAYQDYCAKVVHKILPGIY